ncbi:MAG: ABC transporter permease [Anaerolineae bacterium]|nr:ABC transporter permease [Anaerolineae bacterium]
MLFEAFRIALIGLSANRLRSLLTMLGIIIGVGAVIALVSFGQGVERYVKQTFQSLGSNLLFVFASAPANNAAAIVQPITLADAEAIASPLNAPSVTLVAAQYNLFAAINVGRNSIAITVAGVTPEYQDIRNWYPLAGRFIDEADINSSARVAVLGAAVVEELFDPSIDPLGQQIRINNLPFRVIGVMEERGGSAFGGNEDEALFIPISTAQTRLARARTTDGSYAVSLIMAQAISEERMTVAKQEIEQILRERQNVEFKDEEAFSVITQDQILSVVGNITGLLTVFLGLIAGISLLVGGIGIMNIMLVTVTERTREIGLRKAVGARNEDILLQFLVESVVLSVIGGALGIGLGSLGAFIGGRLVPELQLAVTPGAILLATSVSTAIGVLFGLYPARRASRLEPITALRYE